MVVTGYSSAGDDGEGEGVNRGCPQQMNVGGEERGKRVVHRQADEGDDDEERNGTSNQRVNNEKAGGGGVRQEEDEDEEGIYDGGSKTPMN